MFALISDIKNRHLFGRDSLANLGNDMLEKNVMM
jgi:hypothetical protein